MNAQEVHVMNQSATVTEPRAALESVKLVKLVKAFGQNVADPKPASRRPILPLKTIYTSALRRNVTFTRFPD